MSTARMCPECRVGKHGNCPGWALDDNEQEVACPCPDLSHQEVTVKVYVLVVDRSKTGDVGGILYDHEGHPMGSHMSSTLDFLKSDLTEHPSRVAELEIKYPKGYEVAVVDGEEDAAYAELAALWSAGVTA